MMLVLHVFLTAARHESRFLREASTVYRQLGHHTILAAKWEPGLEEYAQIEPGIEVWRVRLTTLSLPKGLPFQLVKALEWRTRIDRFARAQRPAVLHAHSLAALPTAAHVKRSTGARLIYDAHELETEKAGLQGLRQRLSRRMEQRLIGRCDAVLCVSDSIADWYAERYGMDRPIVVRNVPDHGTQRIKHAVPLRDRLGLGPDDVLFIYQGMMSKGRRVEQFLRVFSRSSLARHVLFMGYGDLESAVKEVAGRRPNIHFLPAVPPGEVLAHTAGADVGLVGVENVCLSYYFSLPNKLFEYLLAGLPVIAGRWPEIRRVVERYQCGWLHDEDDDAVLRLIERIDRTEVTRLRHGVAHARAQISWANEEAKLIQVYRQLAG
jgi:glycosyltransferase involved in cell wall biosynthesis